MRQYGPEGDHRPRLLRTDLVWAHEQFWGDDVSRAEAYEASYKAMGDLTKFFEGLDPKTAAQKDALDRGSRNYGFIGEQRHPHVDSGEHAGPLAADLRGGRLVLPDVRRDGALSKLNPDGRYHARLGRGSVGLAFFLILEFNKPYTGSIRVSPAALEQAIVALDQPAAAEAASQ